MLHLERQSRFVGQLHLPTLRTLAIVNCEREGGFVLVPDTRVATGDFNLNKRVSTATLGALEELTVTGGVVETLEPARRLRSLALRSVALRAPRSLETLQALHMLSVRDVEAEGRVRLAQLASLDRLSLVIDLPVVPWRRTAPPQSNWYDSDLDGVGRSLWFVEATEEQLGTIDLAHVQHVCLVDWARDADKLEQIAAQTLCLRVFQVGSCRQVPWIAAFTELRELRLEVSSVWGLSTPDPFNLAPLASLVHLEKLSLLGELCRDLVGLRSLSRLTNLRRLTLRALPVTNLTPLTKLTKLQVLALQRLSVTDLTPLRKLTALTALDLVHSKVRDVTPLTALRCLERLDVRHTKVTDVSPLAELPRLWCLLVDHSTRYANVAATFPALRYLSFTCLEKNETKAELTDGPDVADCALRFVLETQGGWW